MKLIAKRFVYVILLSGLILTCAACGQPKNEQISEQVVEYVEQLIKSQLKNPNSLIVNNVDCKEDGVSADGRRYFRVVIDFSAQNGFGGYNRETSTYYIRYDKGNMDSLSELEYVNDSGQALYTEKLNAIFKNVPFGAVCNTTKWDLKSYLTRSGIEYAEITVPTGWTYISFVYDFDGLESAVECGIYDSNYICYTNLSWFEGQFHYTGDDFFTLGDGQSTERKRIEDILTSIDSKLGISHTEIEEPFEELYFYPYQCFWELNESIKLKLFWTEDKETGEVARIELISTNAVNGKDS